ncbi:hypothetical protein FRC10_011272 [Ceratobasidium sp. 414]|nr:hypothetical protein FRC10_011272 [Ceratobasidium sp. 414]
MDFTTEPLAYPSYDDGGINSYYATPVSGTPAFASFTPPRLPQYSNMGRVDAEFLGDDPMQEGTNEDKRPIVASGRMTRILGFFPREGQSGTIITVQLVFVQGKIAPKTMIALRVKMGNISLMTSISGVLPTEGVGGHWQLQVVAPDPIELDVVGLEVPLILQALDFTGARIVDDVCIGTFKFVSLASELVVDSTYGRPTSVESSGVSGHIEDVSITEVASITDNPKDSYQQTAKYALGRKRTCLSIDVPSRDVPDDTDSELSPGDLSPMVVRNPPSQSSQKPGEDTYPGSLGIHGDLNNMTNGWSDSEDKSSRRLVEFFCIQTLGHIDVRFAPIHGIDALDPNRNIVSCIWWDEMEDFVITSVDAISLLEKLVGTKFTTEEKNRIRRNLQGFKPSTISKNQADHGPFFKLLMEFPPPRPRHIEKDVKAFSWSKLEGMLEKVISKYVGGVPCLVFEYNLSLLLCLQWFITSTGGAEPDERTGSQNMRVVRDPEGIPDDAFTSVGRAFPSTSSTPQLNPEPQASRTGVLSVAGYIGAAPQTSDNKSLSQVDSPEGSSYPQGHGMETHDGTTFEPADMFMEISEDSVQELLFLQTADDHDGVFRPHQEPYPPVPELPATSSIYLHESDVVVGRGLDGGASFTTHTPR